jgi:type II secretory pathway component PulF
MTEPSGPYSPPPSAPLAELPAPRRGWEKFLLGVGLLGAIVAPLMAHIIVPQFNEVFRNFGAELPFFTKLLVRGYPALWLLPIAVLAAWFRWPRREFRAVAACLIGALSAALFVPVMIVAVYLPIFKLAATI